MRGNNGNFSWGSWEQIFNDFEIKPVVLQNKQVKYYLDPNDFNKKADGSNAVLDGTDGDVMIEFGKTLWWKWTDEGSTYTIEISDKEFDGAVNHAFEIEEGYNLVPYYPLLLTQILFVIFFKVAKYALAVALVVAGVFAFYWFDGQWPGWARGMAVAAGVVAGGAVFLMGTRKGSQTREFLYETRFELRKVVWPTRQEAVRMTWVVIIAVVIIALVMAAYDTVIKWLLRVFLG